MNDIPMVYRGLTNIKGVLILDEKLKKIGEFCKKSGAKFTLQCTIYDDGNMYAEGGIYFEESSPCYLRCESVERVVDCCIEFIDSF